MNQTKSQPLKRHALSLLLLTLSCIQPAPAQSIYYPQHFQHRFTRAPLPKDYVNDIRSEGLFSWPEDKFPIRVYIQSGKNVPGFRQSFRDTIINSFDQWVSISEGKLSWQQVNNPAQADIVVSWIDVPTECKDGTEVGKTRTFARYDNQNNTGVIDRAEMRLLTRLPGRELTDMEVKKAYLHEVGHAFGIAGHSKSPGDIMYYTVSSSHGASLSSRDIATLHALYEENTASARGRCNPQPFANNPLSNSVYR